MKPAPFAFARPQTVAEALSLLASDSDAKAIAGGQSLVPLMNMRLARPHLLVDLNGIAALDYQRLNGMVSLGALTRHSYLAGNEELGSKAPLVAWATRHIGHVATRSRGTLGGSLAHADPAAELPAVLLALDARVLVAGPAGERSLAMDAFARGFFTTALSDGELVVGVELPPDRMALAWGFDEVARRRADFALAGVTVTVDNAGGELRDARVVAFGVADTPVRLTEVERAVEGKEPGSVTPLLARQARDLAARDVAADSYRLDVVAALTRRVFEDLRDGGA